MMRSISETDATGLRAIHVAAQTGDWAGIEAELAAGEPIDAPAGPVSNDKLLSHEGASPLHMAVVGGQVKIAERLLDRGAALDSRTTGDHTPLHYAAWFAPELVAFLVERGADVRAKTWDSLTPLHYVARTEHLEAMRPLLTQDADPNARDRSAMTPLHVAALNGHLNASIELIEAGADPALTDQLRRTPADWARAQGHLELAAALTLA